MTDNNVSDDYLYCVCRNSGVINQAKLFVIYSLWL